MNGDTNINGWNISQGDYVTGMDAEKVYSRHRKRKRFIQQALMAGSVVIMLMLYTAAKLLAG